ASTLGEAHARRAGEKRCAPHVSRRRRRRDAPPGRETLRPACFSPAPHRTAPTPDPLVPPPGPGKPPHPPASPPSAPPAPRTRPPRRPARPRGTAPAASFSPQRPAGTEKPPHPAVSRRGAGRAPVVPERSAVHRKFLAGPDAEAARPPPPRPLPPLRIWICPES